MSLLKLLVLLEARKSTAEYADEGLSLWEDNVEEAFALLDFNRAIVDLSQMSDERLINTLQIVEKKYTFTQDGLVKVLAECNLVCGELFYRRHPDGLQVANVAAEKGYGPTLYYILAKKSRTGFIVSDNSVRPSAIDVWQHFYDNPKVPRKVRIDVETFRNKPTAIRYAYQPTDSKTNLSRLREEYQVGLEDFKEQLKERLEEMYPEKGMIMAVFVDELDFDSIIRETASRHFRNAYDSTASSAADNEQDEEYDESDSDDSSGKSRFHPEADLRDEDLIGEDLSGMNLEAAHLNRANLDEANLSGTNLKRAYLSKASFQEANLTGAALRGAEANGANFFRSSLNNADMRDAQFVGTIFQYAQLQGANLKDADLRNADFLGADLTGADFSGANISQARFSHAIRSPKDPEIPGWLLLNGRLVQE